MKRLFIALELPKACCEQIARVATPIRGVRWLGDQQLHLTIAFLGRTDAEAEARLRKKLADVKVRSFHLNVAGLGIFGGSRPAVIWAGVGIGHPHLFALHKRIHDALFAAQFDPELRSFRPHVTIARLKDVPAPMLKPLLKKYETQAFGRVEIEKFALFSSDQGPNGPVYSIEERYALV